ncbi:hypothetical protein ACFO5K_19765 [Nocardia halotolerans]|uniref:Uncharacterized protein n=1 Tax=Nocardia halotolerans TaxID=1755878 RepID=A0ABV8VP11_9NOCA
MTDNLVATSPATATLPRLTRRQGRCDPIVQHSRSTHPSACPTRSNYWIQVWLSRYVSAQYAYTGGNGLQRLIQAGSSLIGRIMVAVMLLTLAVITIV